MKNKGLAVIKPVPDEYVQFCRAMEGLETEAARQERRLGEIWQLMRLYRVVLLVAAGISNDEIGYYASWDWDEIPERIKARVKQGAENTYRYLKSFVGVLDETKVRFGADGDNNWGSDCAVSAAGGALV